MLLELCQQLLRFGRGLWLGLCRFRAIGLSGPQVQNEIGERLQLLPAVEPELEQPIVAGAVAQVGAERLVQDPLIGQAVQNPFQAVLARRQQPVGNSLLAQQQAGREILAAIGPLLRRRQDQPVLGPRRGDVENPHLFRQAGRLLLLADHLVRQRLQFRVRSGVDDLQAHGVIRIDDHVRVEVPPIELRLELRQKDDGELESLALVHAQDAHGVARGAAGLRRRPVLPRRLEPLDELDEPRQRGDSRVAGKALELDRPVVELEQVGLAGLAVGQGRDERDEGLSR